MAAEQARATQPAWAAVPGHERAALIRQVASVLDDNRAEFESWLVREGGAVPGMGVFEVGLVLGELWEAAALPTQPWGQLLPTAVSGGVLIARLFEEAGLPAGVLHVLPGEAGAGSALALDPNVAMISFTGSTAVGREVGAAAGRTLKRVSLELGGNNAMPDGGTLTISTGPGDFDGEGSVPYPAASPQRYVELAVTDTGTGMSKQVLARIFERFFSTKPPGTGTGLGLSTVHGIIADAGGMIAVESEEGRGTTFRIYLPAALS